MTPDPALVALQGLLAPATMTTRAAKAPKVRRACCEKCPFGTGLTADEARQADVLRARLAGRLAGGEQVIWGCHKTVHGGKPQVCPGFVEWTRPRPELAA